MTGKNYNHCKRIHNLFATKMEILHFKSFLEKHGDETISDEIVLELDVIRKEKYLNNHVHVNIKGSYGYLRGIYKIC